jgi:hypothetical protein
MGKESKITFTVQIDSDEAIAQLDKIIAQRKSVFELKCVKITNDMMEEFESKLKELLKTKAAY